MQDNHILALVELFKNSMDHPMGRIILFDRDEDTGARSVNNIIGFEAGAPNGIFTWLKEHRDAHLSHSSEDYGVRLTTPEGKGTTIVRADLTLTDPDLDREAGRYINAICRNFAKKGGDV